MTHKEIFDRITLAMVRDERSEKYRRRFMSPWWGGYKNALQTVKEGEFEKGSEEFYACVTAGMGCIVSELKDREVRDAYEAAGLEF